MADEFYLSFGVLMFTLATYFAYLFFNLYVKKRKLHRVADDDLVMYNRLKSKAEKEKFLDRIEQYMDSNSQYVSQVAPMTIAVIILSLQLIVGFPAGSIEYMVNLLVLGGVAISGIMYLMATEEYATAGSPSVLVHERFQLYAMASNLIVAGFFMMWSSILLALSLTRNVYVVIIGCAVTLVILVIDHEKRWAMSKR